MLLVFNCKPSSRNTQIFSSIDKKSYHVSLKSPARDGLANEELIKLLATRLKISKSNVIIKSGHTGRVKYIEIPDGTDLEGLIF